jgi:integrase
MKNLTMDQCTDELADAYRDFIDKTMNLSAKTINASLSYMGRFFQCGIKKKWCDRNPFDLVERIDKRQKQSTNDERYEPLTSEEIDRILNYLNEKGERDWIRFLSMIFYAWARPAEIARLKVKDINLKDDLIRFPKGETKNGLGAFVQIVPPLKEILQEMQLHNFDPDWYLFSNNGFLPGTQKLEKSRSWKRWTALVHRDLKIKKNQYALKHTGNIMYLLRNKCKVDLKWQQMQNRHSSSTMTDRYNRKLGAYFVNVDKLNFKNFNQIKKEAA